MTTLPLVAPLPQDPEELGSAPDEGAETAEKGTEGLKEFEEHHARLPARGPGAHQTNHNNGTRFPEAGKTEDPALPTTSRPLRLTRPGAGRPVSQLFTWFGTNSHLPFPLEEMMSHHFSDTPFFCTEPI